jgi:hypothetical protein
MTRKMTRQNRTREGKNREREEKMKKLDRDNTLNLLENETKQEERREGIKHR